MKKKTLIYEEIQANYESRAEALTDKEKLAWKGYKVCNLVMPEVENEPIKITYRKPINISTTGEIMTVNNYGAIKIPKSLRESMKFDYRQLMEFFVNPDNGDIILRKCKRVSADESTANFI